MTFNGFDSSDEVSEAKRLLIAYGDNGLDNAGFWKDEGRERIGHFVEANTMSNPGRCVQRTRFDKRDDPFEIGRQCISRTEQRSLGLVEGRVSELDLFGGDPNKYEPPGVRDITKRIGHRSTAARGIDHNVR